MAEELTREGLCTTKGCPWSSDPDAHIPWCGHGLSGTHQHWPKRSQGGKQIVAILCMECHDRVDNQMTMFNHVDSGNYTLTDGENFFIRREIATARPLNGSQELVPAANEPEPLPQITDADWQRATKRLGILGMLTPVGWRPDVNASIEEWGRSFEIIQDVNTGSEWAVWDAINFGEDKFGEMAWQYITDKKYARSTINNKLSVARRVPLERRRPRVSWSHHEAVAALGPDEQDMYLEACEQTEINVMELRALISGRPTPAECSHAWEEVTTVRCAICKQRKENDK